MTADADFQFPRVTRYRVEGGRRVVPMPASRPVERRRGAAVRKATAIVGAVVDKSPLSPTWSAIGGALGLAVSLCAVVVAVYGGDSRASAAPAFDVATIERTYPTGRDRVVIGRDGSLRSALMQAAVAPGDIDRVVAEAISAGGSERMRPGAKVDLIFSGRTADDAYRQLQMATLFPKLDTSLTVARSEGQLVGRTTTLKIDHTPLRLYGYFGQNPRASLISAGIPAAAADEYLRALRGHVDPRTLTSGDRYDVVVEQAASSSGERQLGNLIYAGLYQDEGINLQLSQWTLGKKLRWFDVTEASQSRDNVQRPVPGAVSSNYGSRMHPILGYTRMHKGLDFKAGYGTPILAVQTGWVTGAGWRSGYGQQVELTHGAGMRTSYSHMSQMTVRQGQLVEQGDVIGYVGATGLATGPHLHYEVHQNGAPIDPASISFRIGPQLSGDDLAGYRRRLEALLAVPVAKAR